MYDLYIQGGPTRSFRTATALRDSAGLDADTVFRLICGESVSGMRVSTRPDVMEPLDYRDIAARTGMSEKTARNTVALAIRSLERAGTLKPCLEMIRQLRAIEQKPGRYDIEFETTISISVEESSESE